MSQTHINPCYLWDSGVFDENQLAEDSLFLYNDYLNDNEVSDYFKQIIIEFLLPFKISFLKFNLNMEYFDDPFPTDIHNQHKHIAPSLKLLKQEPWDIPLGYPAWFISAFPDVVCWARRGTGKDLIFSKLEGLSEDQLIEGKHIKRKILLLIINMYLENTNEGLECKKYY